ncbi:hypothetical protein Goshw_017387 [Gossypium schwendimanii]|uniref:Aminotransferase-like plant mobile domain-containing protein n=1 Tax=Gossypium schwendimanii TaxID=34291 RepID=A0A7J9NA68_GOSSC|nr:hypothetical protein [Gossypium schwendimanii]
MENEFLDKVEDNAVVQTWSEATQREKGDSLAEGYVSELWDFTRISVTQNSLQELKEIWDQWNDKFWNPAYSCFTFRRGDLVPTVEEYMALLRCSKIQADKKGVSKCIPWRNLRDLILAHPDVKKKVDVFALSVYDLVVFPKALGHVNEAVTDLFDRLDKRVTPVLAILAETFRSLNKCRRADNGYKKKIRGMSNAWNQTRRMKRLVVGPITTPEYIKWWGRRINDNISRPSQGDSQPTQKHLQVVPSELEIIKRDFKRRSAKLEKKIEQMEEEKMNLRLDMVVQKLETEKLRKGKNKAEGDLDNLKIDYKRLRCSMKAAGLGKISEQWCQEIQEENIKYRNRNSVMDLRASLDRIEQMKRRVEELEMALQSCEMRIGFLEANEERKKE